MQTPTARMRNAGDASLAFSHTSPYTWMNADAQPLDWLEVTMRYMDLLNMPYGSADFSGDQTYKDKSIDIKLKLWNETAHLPQVAVGVRDLAGTGLWSSEYVVASKRTSNLDWSVGLAWGYMGGRGNLANPLSVLGSNFRTRQGGAAATGEVGITSWFTGPTSLFGGVQYQTPWIRSW